MKIILLLISALCLILPLHAEERDCLLVRLNNGNQVFFLLKDYPKITFDNGLVSIATEQYQFSNIRKYTLEDSENIGTGVSAPKEEGGQFFIEDGVLYITAKDDSKNVKLFSVDGKEIPISHERIQAGLISVRLPNYGSGVYLLQIGSETLKISVR